MNLLERPRRAEPVAPALQAVRPPAEAPAHHEAHALKERSVRGGMAAAASQATRFVLQTGCTAILARLLTPSDYGLVAMAGAVVALATSFKDLGLSTATIQRPSITPEQVSGLFWINVATSLLIMLVMSAVAPLVARIYGRPELTGVLIAFAAMTPLSGLGAQHHALLQRSMRFTSLALRDVTALLAGSAAALAAARAGMGYWSLVILQAVSSLVGLAMLWWKSDWRPVAPRWDPSLGPLLKFGGTLTLSNLLGFLMKGLDNLLLGYFLGPAATGLYNRAQNLVVSPIRQFMPTLMSVVTSAFSRMADDAPRFERNATQLIALVAILTGLVVAVMIGTADWIVGLLLGRQWAEAVPIFALLALFAFVEPCASALATLLIAGGKPERLLRWRLFSAPIVVGGLLAGLPWGVLGVAAAYSLSGLLIRAPLFILYTARTNGWRCMPLLLAVAYPAGIGLLVAAWLVQLRTWWVPAHPAIGILAFGIFGVLAYLAFVLASPSVRASVRFAGELFLAGRRSSPGSIRRVAVEA